MFIKLFCRLLVDHLQRFQVLFQVRIFKGGEKLPSHENMWWSKARKVKVRVVAALLFSYTLYSYSLNLNHWIRQKTCHCKGTQTSMSEKCTDQAAVVEPNISSPDISLHIQSESSPESTSLNESSNPNTPYSTSWKVSLCFSFCYLKVSCCTRLEYVMNKKQQEVSHPVKFSWSKFVPHYCSLSFRLRILM